MDPYGLVNHVSIQGPKFAWPQLLHLSPKMRCQWAKMVSTRTKTMGLVSADARKDVLTIMQENIKGCLIPKVCVDGGAQMCVMSEKMMHMLGS